MDVHRHGLPHVEAVQANAIRNLRSDSGQGEEGMMSVFVRLGLERLEPCHPTFCDDRTCAKGNGARAIAKAEFPKRALCQIGKHL